MQKLVSLIDHFTQLHYFLKILEKADNISIMCVCHDNFIERRHVVERFDVHAWTINPEVINNA